MIKYRYRVMVSQKTGLYHIVFEDVLAAKRLWRKFSALVEEHFTTDDIKYEHNGGFQPSIVLTNPDGVLIWNDIIAPYTWLDREEEGRPYFLTNDAGDLIQPDVCCVCKAKSPPITETVVSNGRAVAVNKYCAHHGEYTQQMLIEAGLNG